MLYLCRYLGYYLIIQQKTKDYGTKKDGYHKDGINASSIQCMLFLQRTAAGQEGN